MKNRARRESRPLSLAVALTLLSAPIHVGAQVVETQPRAESVAVRFPRGATSVAIEAPVSDGVDRDYVLHARQGQTLTVRLDDPQSLAGVRVISPDWEGGEEWTAQARQGWHDGVWSTQLPASGNYRVRLRGVAPRAASVWLVVGITDPPLPRWASSSARGIAGHYGSARDGGRIDITRRADGRLWFELEALWGNGYTTHVGTAEGEVVLHGGVWTYIQDNCRLTFGVTNHGISVAHSGSDVDCAFGANVTVDGLYRRH